MAYKDEYEVPRLCLDQEVDARVREAFGSNARVSYKLHPPFLRAMGMNRKLTLGPWVRPFFRALAALRFLRGSFLDPFGHTQHSSFGTAVDRGVPSVDGRCRRRHDAG